MPSCVTIGMLKYATDLQNASQSAMKLLLSTSRSVPTKSNALLSLDQSSLTAGLTDALESVVGVDGLLDVSNLLNTPQPITSDLPSTVLAVEVVLEGVERELTGIWEVS